MAWPVVGVVGGGEASAASEPATGSRSTWHDRRWFGRLEQEDQRLKKHYGRWMDIVRSLELESFILTKLTKPSVPVNLVGPQVSLPLYWVPANRGSIHFFVRNKEALPCVRRYSWWVRPIFGGGGTFFSQNTEALPTYSPCTMRNKEELSLRTTMDLVGPSRQALHVQSSSDDSRLLTTLHRAQRGGGRQRGPKWE